MIRRAGPDDAAAILAIVMPVIRAGDTYALDRDMSPDDALSYWTGPDRETYVLDDGGDIVGTYYLRRNQAGGGDHVCNAGYMTAASATGRGIGARMANHSFGRACELGYRAMQFNFLVSSNVGAVALWTRLGFAIVGRLPEAFHHPRSGYVDALVMYRML